MNRQLASLLTLCGGLILPLAAGAADDAPSLEPLQGKWSTTKTRQDQTYTQVLEIKKDRLTLQILDANAQLRMIAKGTIKTEKLGAFTVLQVFDITGGRSADDLQPVDDTRALVYSVRDANLFMAANFDKDRGREKPVTDEYTRVETAAAKADGGDLDKVVGNWKLVVTVGENDRNYELKIARENGQLAGTLVSSRSGEYKCKKVQFTAGELLVEVDREMGGNPVTLVLKAKLTEAGLSGTVSAAGDDQLTGKIKATK